MGGGWSRVWGEPDWIGGSIAVDGQRATVVLVKLLPEPGTTGRSVLEEPRYPTRLDTLTTSDGGVTWTLSRGSTQADGCVVQASARDERLAIATCAEEERSRLLRTTDGTGQVIQQ